MRLKLYSGYFHLWLGSTLALAVLYNTRRWQPAEFGIGRYRDVLCVDWPAGMIRLQLPRLLSGGSYARL